MKQSVDLFPAHLRHDPVALGALHALYATGVLLVLLIGISFLTGLQANNERNRLTALRADVESQRVALAALEQSHPAIAIDEALAAQTDQLERERAAKTSVLALISQGELGNRAGFSPHLEALASHPVAGIWLERVVIGAGGREVSIYGSTVEGSRVPRLLQALGESATFQGRSFHTLRMERHEKSDGYVHFALSARPDPQDADEARR